jgi:AhpD family alkylhydroperoxidase
MSRIAGATHAGPLTRATLFAARRKTAQMTEQHTEQMIEPLEVFAHAPRILLGYGALELAFEKSTLLERRIKELAVLKAATMVECEYCIDIGSAIARGSGLSDEQLLALAHHRDSGLFDEREMLVLDYAAAVSRTPIAVEEELFASLREHFDDAQLVELTSAIALENFRARFNGALDIGSAGFSEGRVCALPQSAAANGHPLRAVSSS